MMNLAAAILLCLLMLGHHNVLCEHADKSRNKDPIDPLDVQDQILHVKASLDASSRRREFITVHMVSHTHDDVGWLKTVDQYFIGSKNWIQKAGVQNIISSTINALLDNPERKFIYVEMAFFMRWWRQQTASMQAAVRGLVARGQLEFINGGWAMNDEAGVHYQATIDQMTLGHQFLMENFGVVPSVSWQIDPFGHSSTFASLVAQMGFDGLFFGRIDYQDAIKRRLDREMEFVFSPSQSLGHTSDIWTGVLFARYCQPPGFDWDINDQDIVPVQDDDRLDGYNVGEVADAFAATARVYHAAYRHDQVLIPMGCDFEFEGAEVNFQNMERLMAYVNARQERYGMQLVYSTPSQYLRAVHSSAASSGLQWSVVSGSDFFPYASGPFSVWSGYFTSRPALKGYCRAQSAFLHAVEQVHTLVRALQPAAANWTSQLQAINTLQQALGVAQHHDAIAGTEKQHVADDYAKQLSVGSAQALATLSQNAYLALRLNASASTPSSSFAQCPLANVSICPAAASALSPPSTGVLVVVVYNSLAWARTEILRIPVPVAAVAVRGGTNGGGSVPSEVHPNPETANYTLVFQATLQPLGFTTYFVVPDASVQPVAGGFVAPGAGLLMKNEQLAVQISGQTNRLASVTLQSSNTVVPIAQDFLWYNASAGNNDVSHQASGAYVFRPNASLPFPTAVDASGDYSPTANPTLWMSRGALLTQAYQTFNPWVQQFIRLYANASFIEFENVVGPIDIADGLGKEVVTRYTTNFSSAGAWYTDSNGQEMQWRQRDYRQTYDLKNTEPVADNYYPVNSAVYLPSPSDSLRLTVVVDRSEGCSSLHDGELEIMVHRRLLYDDHKGVGEPLNETEQVRTLHRTLVGPAADQSAAQRYQSEVLNNSPVLLFASSPSVAAWSSRYASQFSSIATPLPANVELLSLQSLPNGSTLLRLHHLYAANEAGALSNPASVDLGALFSPLLAIQSIVETQLTGVRQLANVTRLTWNSTAGTTPTQPQNNPVSVDQLVVVLNPMQIRTFVIALALKTT